jgi:polysaccharide export outer membrane protein
MAWRLTLPFAACFLLGACGHVGTIGYAPMVADADEFGVTTVVRADHEERLVHEPVQAWSTHVAVGPVPVAVVVGDDGHAPYLLDTGDRLRIFVYGQPSLSRLYPVDHDGRISVPLIGHVTARGATTAKLEQVIKARLGAQYVKDPHVTVDIAQNRPFFILGEVRQAGQYPFVSGMTVQAAVAIAGGFSERANERHMQISRRVNGVIEKWDVPSDTIVQPGDTVYVKERWF